MCAIDLDAELRCSALEGELRDAAGISWPKSLLLVPSLVFPPQPPGTELWFSWDWRGFVSSGILGSLRAAFPCMSSVLGCPLCVIQLCPVRNPAVPWTRSSCASNTIQLCLEHILTPAPSLLPSALLLCPGLALSIPIWPDKHHWWTHSPKRSEGKRAASQSWGLVPGGGALGVRLAHGVGHQLLVSLMLL